MTSSQSHHQETRLADPDLVHPELVAPQSRAGQVARYTAAALRLSLGWVFLWAFLDKTFGLGYATESRDAWIDGGSPTFGFLSFGATCPFKGSTTPSLVTPGRTGCSCPVCSPSASP
jgi:thiosulfate dehydrogenase (quinone) large subunit